MRRSALQCPNECRILRSFSYLEIIFWLHLWISFDGVNIEVRFSGCWCNKKKKTDLFSTDCVIFNCCNAVYFWAAVYLFGGKKGWRSHACVVSQSIWSPYFSRRECFRIARANIFLGIIKILFFRSNMNINVVMRQNNPSVYYYYAWY